MKYAFNFTHINVLIILLLLLSGCSRNIPSLSDRKDKMYELIKNKETSQVKIKTSGFNLFSIQKISNRCQDSSMKIYIEGDGLSWITRSIVSDDPTPLTPVGLNLMFSDESDCKVYIARPCQYIDSKECEKKYWTSHRFNTKIIQSFDEALDNLKSVHKNSSFTLVGYSGGGAVATLLASKRDDVDMLITVAGNLDIDKWTTMHRISELDGSLNPSDFSDKLENILQYHLIGKEDNIIPKDIFLSYKDNFRKKDKIKYSLHKASHSCCWNKIYKDFLKGLKKDEK